MTKKIFISAGELSGDIHAAKLISALLSKNNSVKVYANGGDNMKKAGAELLYHINDLSFIPHKEYDVDKQNVGFKVLDVHAIKNIKKGEELSLAYGPDYWDDVREETSRRQDIENQVSRIE